MPCLAGGSVLAAVAVTAVLVTGASAAPKNAAVAAVAGIAASPGFSAQLAADSTDDSALVASAARNLTASESSMLRARGVPCDIRADACVSLSKQEAWLLRDGRVVYGPVRVATGRAGLPTPTGDFHVWYKVVDGWSTTYDAPMPYSVFFYGGDAFHEDPVSVRSHGCVHLSLAHAEYFYRFLQYGDLVEVRH
jgi:hypothetical protein